MFRLEVEVMALGHVPKMLLRKSVADIAECLLS